MTAGREHDVTEQATEQTEHSVLDQLRAAAGEEDTERVQELLEEFGAADLAELTAFFEPDEKAFILAALPAPEAAEFVRNASDESLRDVAEVEWTGLRRAIRALEPDEMADVLDVLPDEAAQHLLKALTPKDARAATHLLTFDPDTAGGRMTPEFVVLHEDVKAGEAVKITQRSRDQETIAHLLVTDEDDRLVGHLPLHRLVFARPHRKLKDLLREETITVTPETDEEEVVRLAQRYDLQIVPVVDGSGRPVGVITADDILDAAQDEADEDIYALAGTAEVDPVHSTVPRGVLLRLPWLMLSLVDGLFIAFLSSRYESTLQIASLAFFIPLIPLMGGNVAVQSSTIVVRALAVGGIRPQTVADFARRQGVVVLLLALACGLIAGLMATLFVTGPAYTFMLVVGGSVGLAISVAGSLGLALPFAFRALGIDPAVSAGPFVTMLNDAFCIFIYLTLATLLLY